MVYTACLTYLTYQFDYVKAFLFGTALAALMGTWSNFHPMIADPKRFFFTYSSDRLILCIPRFLTGSSSIQSHHFQFTYRSFDSLPS